MPDKREVILMSDKKMGRPTDNPKLNKISIRISDEDKGILDKYCEKENVNKDIFQAGGWEIQCQNWHLMRASMLGHRVAVGSFLLRQERECG